MSNLVFAPIVAAYPAEELSVAVLSFCLAGIAAVGVLLLVVVPRVGESFDSRLAEF